MEQAEYLKRLQYQLAEMRGLVLMQRNLNAIHGPIIPAKCIYRAKRDLERLERRVKREAA